MKNVFLIFLSFLSVQTFSDGQQSKLDSVSYQLDTVFVSTSRFEQPIYQIPFAIDILDSESLSFNNESLSVESLFNLVPGIVINNRNNLSEGDRIIIRGIGTRSRFGVRGIKILLDGIPLTFPDGQSQLNNLDINSIGRIEIIRGPSAFLYGNSSGGIIYITSKEISSPHFNYSPKFTIGSFGLQKYSLSSFGKIGNNSLFVNLDKIISNGFRENSDVNSNSVNIISKQKFNEKISLQAVLNYYDAPYLLNPSSLNKSDARNNPRQARQFVKQQGAGKNISQTQTGFTLVFAPNENQKLETTLYGIWRSMFNPIPGRIIKLKRFSGGIRTNYSFNLHLLNTECRILMGFDYEFQNDDRKEYENLGVEDYADLAKSDIINHVRIGNNLLNQKEKVDGLGTFSKIEFTPIDNISFSFGLRYDNYKFSAVDNFFLDDIDNSGSLVMKNISGMGGLVYRVNNELQIFTNYSTSFQTPTTSELSNKADGSGGFNISLKPEQLKNIELGFRGSKFNYHLLYNITFYKLILSNMIIPYQIPETQSDEVFFKNAGKAVNNGMDLSINIFVSNKTNFIISYSYMDFKYTDLMESIQINNVTQSFKLDGKYVPGIPKNNFGIGIKHSFGFGLSSELTLNWNDKYFANDWNGPEPNFQGNISDYVNDSFITAGLKLKYNLMLSFAQFDFFLGITNLMNTKYNGSIITNAAQNRFFEPSPGRNWYSGLSINFN